MEWNLAMPCAGAPAEECDEFVDEHEKAGKSQCRLRLASLER
jgi:hypothetical protein